MQTARKTIITCAITGGVHTPTMSPHLPITPDQIAREAVAAAEAGAAIVHLHARDPKTGKPSPDPRIFGEFLSKIKQQCNAIINITTGGGLGFSWEDRLAAPLEFAPEIASFNMGPLNFGLFPLLKKYKDFKFEWERELIAGTRVGTYLNTFEWMERLAKSLGEERGVRFEYECFDIGHLHTLRYLVSEGIVKPPLFIQSCYGILGGLQPDPHHVMHMKETADRLFGDDYQWSNLAAGRHQMRVVAMGAIMGAHVRVGLEDSLSYGRGELAKSNADQVARIRRILEELSMEIASPDEAREILNTKGSDKVNF
jgi:uncharacterized protein (DUF849 family)